MLLKSLSLSILVALLSATAQAQNYAPGEIIVKLKGKSGTVDSYAFMGKAQADHGMQLKQTWSKMNMYHFALGKGQRVEDKVAELKKDPNVLYVEPNYYLTKSNETGLQQTFTAAEVTASGTANTTSYMATSADIGVQNVWSNGGAVPTNRPVVAVIDTGLDTTHSVMTGTNVLWTNPGEIAGNGVDDEGNGYVDDVHGWNFVDNSPTIYDDDGHGTHVSGIILSIDQNIYATPLRQAKIQIMPLKFLNGSGVGTTSDAIRAIYYASNNGAAVLNNSWGGSEYSAALNEAVAYSYSKGALFVAAAGNAGSNNDSTPMYPASYNVPNIVSVAATTDYDYLASFSNFGNGTVQLGSPGVYILSTIPNNSFGTMSGTSMATPFVSGTAGQMKVGSPNMLGYQLKTILLGQTSLISQLQGKVSTSGRLNSSGSVTYAKAATVDTTQPAYTLSYGNDRELASSMAGGGCGLVKAMENGQDGEPPFGSSAAVVVLLLMPVAILLALRMHAPENRRRFERFKINSDVRISVGDRELIGSISSLSLGGAQVNTTALLQDGGLVTLSISSPSGDEKVEVAGRVVWSAANKAYGVAFDSAPQSALSRIADWTHGLKRAS
ncbi:MAG: S8 family serine peptidase [Bdellovibrionales bacterium]